MDAWDGRWKVAAQPDYKEAADLAQQVVETLRVLREGGFKAPHAPRMEEQAREKVVRLCGKIVGMVK